MNLAQRAFAGGEIAPALHSRTDQEKYAFGLRTCRNMIVLKHGGLGLRPGTKYIAEVKDSTKTVRLVKFVFNDDQTYVMEFGDGYIRWLKDGARVAVASAAAWADATDYVVGDMVDAGGDFYYCIADHTSVAATNEPGSGAAWQTVWHALTGSIYEIPSPYAEADLPRLQFVQSADVVTIVHPSYAPRELARYADTQWILSEITFGPSIDPPSNFARDSGGTAGDTFYWAITALKEGTLEESLVATVSAAFEPDAANPVVLSWDFVPGAVAYNIYRGTDGATYGFLRRVGATTATETDTSWGDSDETASSLVPSVWAPAAGQLRNALTISATSKAVDGRYTVAFTRTLTVGAGGSGARGRIGWYYQRNTDASRVFVGYSNEIMLIGEGTMGPTGETITIDVPDDGYTGLTIDGVPEVLPFSAHTCTMNGNTGSAPYNEVEWQSATGTFSDEGDAPDYSLAPPVQNDNLTAIDRRPAAVTYYNQRQVFGNTNTEPEKVWASRIASYRSLAISTPLADDDRIAFQVAGRQVNEVRHLLDLEGLLVFTAGAEVFVHGNADGAFTPDAPNPKHVSYNGASWLSPLVVVDSALYVQARGNIVRDLTPVRAEGAKGSYVGTDLTVFSGHLFEGYTIDDWDFQRVPDAIVWAVRSDGTLLGLTYLREHGIWAWHRHDTDGEVENVCVVPEDDEDVVYLVVKRTINGTTERYIERLMPRVSSSTSACWHVDAGALYSGGAATTITGLDHLEGENVTVVADGVVIHNPNDSTLAVKTVSGGQITIASAASTVLVGLPFIGDVETLDIDSDDGKSIKEQKFILGRVLLSVYKSRGFYMGKEGTQTGGNPLANLQPYRSYASATELITDTVDVPIEASYDTHGRVLIRQVNPLPLTILAIIPVGNFGDN